jgi:xanthine/uracil/vitamin C permease (AzgA family)
MIGAYPPITAPALTIVGAMMMQNVVKIDWNDYTESVPAFLIIVGIPFSYSIAEGLALGFMLSIKLVTVLVPSAAPATLPIASGSMACFAGGNLLSRMNPACSHTQINVPIASNVSMKRKTKI